VKWSVILCVLLAGRAYADGKSQAAKEAADYVLERFGRQAVKEGTEVLARKIEQAAARHGGEVIEAVRKVGPRALPLLEEAGEHAAQAAKVMARHGEAGAVSVVARPAAMALVAKHGESVAAVLVKHGGGIAEPVVGKFGAPAIRALEASGPQAGRRLAMLAEDGVLSKLGHSEEVLEVIAKYGDRATKFVWENKGALAVGTTLATFLANPEPFLDGTKALVNHAITEAVKPLAEVPGVVAREAAGEVSKGTNWTMVFLAIALGVLLVMNRSRSFKKGGTP
jgi:hypothetical protein